ncbi:hypothetical protein HG531_013079 [Fusarium graminearum]|nr:hypothetical protein HG531_013079 [Fusarium graminearum]
MHVIFIDTLFSKAAQCQFDLMFQRVQEHFPSFIRLLVVTARPSVTKWRHKSIGEPDIILGVSVYQFHVFVGIHQLDLTWVSSGGERVPIVINCLDNETAVGDIPKNCLICNKCKFEESASHLLRRFSVLLSAHFSYSDNVHTIKQRCIFPRKETEQLSDEVYPVRPFGLASIAPLHPFIIFHAQLFRLE